MAQNSSGSAWIMAAVILGIAIVGSSYMLTASIDRATVQVEQTLSALQNIEIPSAPAPAQPAARPSNRPDPGKVYQVAVGKAPVKGPANAKVTIVEFSDFQCPFCSRVNPTLAKIHETYPNDVRIAFKHMPLSFHQQAPAAHAASQAAANQGKFWEMHDKIFGNQRELNAEAFERYATELGLDIEKFKKDSASAEVKALIRSDQSQASKLGVTGTPGFFVNGRFLSGAQPFESFKRLIDEELNKS